MRTIILVIFAVCMAGTMTRCEDNDFYLEDLNDANSRIESLNNRINSLEDMVYGLTYTIHVNEEIISDLNDELTTIQAHAQFLNEALENRDSYINVLEDEADELEDHIETLEGAISDLQSQVYQTVSANDALVSASVEAALLQKSGNFALAVYGSDTIETFRLAYDNNNAPAYIPGVWKNIGAQPGNYTSFTFDEGQETIARYYPESNATPKWYIDVVSPGNSSFTSYVRIYSYLNLIYSPTSSDLLMEFKNDNGGDKALVLRVLEWAKNNK